MHAADAAFVRTALVDLAIGGEAAALAAAREIGARGLWRPVTQIALAWRLVPQLRDALVRCGAEAAGAIAAPEVALIRQASFARAAESAAIVRACAVVQRELESAGVTSVAAKGVATIATLYGSSSKRMISDVDLIVRDGDLAAARAALDAAGYTDVSPPFETHLSDIAHSRHLHNFARTFVRDGTEIDLHWQFGPKPAPAFRTAHIVERSLIRKIEGKTVRVTGPIETALLAVHHALRGSFAAHSTPKDLADLKIWWEREGEACGEELIRVAVANGLGSSLGAMALAIASRDPRHPIATCGEALRSRATPRLARETAALHAFLEHNVRGESPDDATVELLAPAVFLRAAFGRGVASVRATLRGVKPHRNAPEGERRPLFQRVFNRLSRGGRIARELLRFGRVANYRAVACAQSRLREG